MWLLGDKLNTCVIERGGSQRKMADFLSGFLSYFLSDQNVYIAFSLALGALLIAVIVRRSRQSASMFSNTSRCSSPRCARCNCEKQIQGKLLKRLQEHATETHRVADPEEIDQILPQNYSRVLSTIESYARKDEVLSAIYKESGYGETQTSSLAHVWMMPGLRRAPFWSATDHSVMEKLFLLFEDSRNFEAIWQEYMAVSKLRADWMENNIPTGSWSTYFLMNQGKWDQEKSTNCPQTRHLLESTECLAEGSIYGNVMFSVLKPGSMIEPHTSPCNFRLRCHLALCASTGFTLRVGECTGSWETSRLLIFDDSFVHSVEHRGSLGQDADKRVVLIFDIWHPDISHSEQQALKYTFNL